MKLLKESNQHRQSVWSWLETFDLLYQNSGDFPTRSVATVLYLGHAVDIVIIIGSVCVHDITLYFHIHKWKKIQFNKKTV